MEKRKGGRVKAVWNATVRNIGLAFNHRYEGNTLVGASYGVILRVMLDREPDRAVSVSLSPEDARKWSRALAEYADKAEALNNKI